MLGDLGHDLPSSLFLLCEFTYPQGRNTKGLLRIKADDDFRIDYAKPAYHACRNVTAIFDNSLQRVRDDGVQPRLCNSEKPTVQYRYRQRATGHERLVFWQRTECSDTVDATSATLGDTQQVAMHIDAGSKFDGIVMGQEPGSLQCGNVEDVKTVCPGRHVGHPVLHGDLAAVSLEAGAPHDRRRGRVSQLRHPQSIRAHKVQVIVGDVGAHCFAGGDHRNEVKPGWFFPVGRRIGRFSPRLNRLARHRCNDTSEDHTPAHRRAHRSPNRLRVVCMSFASLRICPFVVL